MRCLVNARLDAVRFSQPLANFDFGHRAVPRRLKRTDDKGLAGISLVGSRLQFGALPIAKGRCNVPRSLCVFARRGMLLTRARLSKRGSLSPLDPRLPSARRKRMVQQ